MSDNVQTVREDERATVEGVALKLATLERENAALHHDIERHVQTAAELATENADLRRRLAEMEQRKDAAYLERNQVVSALSKVFPSGVARTAIEGWSEDWHGCVYIDLPTGQASWHFHDSHAHLFAHLPPYQGEWDGHSTDEKYARLASLKTERNRLAEAERRAEYWKAEHLAGNRAIEQAERAGMERAVEAVENLQMKYSMYHVANNVLYEAKDAIRALMKEADRG